MDIQWKRRLAILGIAAGVYVGYAWLLPVAVPFLAAWFLAVWLHPYAVKMEKRWKLKKNVWGTVLLTLVFGAAGLLLFLGAKELFSQLRVAVSHAPVWLRVGEDLLERGCALTEETLGLPGGTALKYAEQLGAVLVEKLPEFLGARAALFLSGGVKTALVLLSGAGVAYISAILILGDMENLRRKIWDYPWLVGTRRVVKRLKRTTAVYLKAQVVLMAVTGAVCAAAFWLMKSPYFLILGILLAAFDALPLIGTGIFLYPAAAVFLLRGNAGVALGCVLLDIVTGLIREFLEPRLLGDGLGISPLAVLASVYIGVFLFGGWGVILGPLAFSTAYEIGKEWDVWD